MTDFGVVWPPSTVHGPSIYFKIESVFFLIYLRLLVGENSHGLALHIALPTIASVSAVVIVIIAVCGYCRYHRKEKQGIKLPNIEGISAV